MRANDRDLMVKFIYCLVRFVIPIPVKFFVLEQIHYTNLPSFEISDLLFEKATMPSDCIYDFIVNFKWNT